jgi:hypothetical protein
MGGILDVACCCVTTDCFVSVSNGSCIFSSLEVVENSDPEKNN